MGSGVGLALVVPRVAEQQRRFTARVPESDMSSDR